jgi:dual specificity phosphatase 12
MLSSRIDSIWESKWLHISCVCLEILMSFPSSSIMAARSSRSLSERRISHILSVCTDHIPAEMPESGIAHMRIPIEDVDYADLLIHLPRACRFIDHALRSQGVVLVHCVQGICRSAAVVAAYRERIIA